MKSSAQIYTGMHEDIVAYAERAHLSLVGVSLKMLKKVVRRTHDVTLTLTIYTCEPSNGICSSGLQCDIRTSLRAP